MAFLVPTNAQKSELEDSIAFKDQVKWAVLTLANYWKNQNGENLTAADALKWRKHQYYAISLLSNPRSVESNIDEWTTSFVIEASNFDIVDDQQGFSTAVVISRMLSQNYFEAIANLVFAQRIAQFL